MRKRMFSDDAFTLIELLTVVLIIGILCGLVFKMFSAAARSAGEAETRAKIEKLAMAVNEYKAEYGIYPPVESYGNSQPMSYAYENPMLQPQALHQAFSGSSASPQAPKRQFGLVAYLVKCPADPPGGWEEYLAENPGAEYPQYHPDVKSSLYNSKEWLEDNERDAAFKLRVKPFLEGVVHFHMPDDYGGFAGLDYGASVQTVVDAWLKTIHYECKPPYRSYRLWSNGPNMINDNGKGDDIVVGKIN